MKRKIILSLSFLTVFLTLLWSCHSEDFIQPEDASQLFAKNATSAKFVSRSLWKEDVLYIGKVQQVFLKHANLERFNATYGELNWDYAMSYGQFGEKYALVPITKKNKVVLLMEAVRIGNKVYFYEKKDENLQTFFEQVMYSNIVGFDEKINTQGSPSAKGLSYVCSTRTIHVGCANGEVNCPPASNTTMVCEWVISNHPPKGLPPSGDPNFEGGGGNDGYEYPDPPVETPCEKLKEQTSNNTFKNNITSLEGKTGDSFESGYRIGTNSNGSLQNQMLQNKPGTQQVDLKAFSNTITLMHSHYDGLYPMFSPGDIIFFNQWIVWAQNWNAIPTNTPKIPLNNLTFTLVTSNGNYSFNFDGTSTNPLPNYTIVELNNLNEKYSQMLNNAVTVGNVSGNVSYNMEKLETQFLKFMSEKMNMDGLQLYKTTTDGNSKLSLENGTRQETDCPN